MGKKNKKLKKKKVTAEEGNISNASVIFEKNVAVSDTSDPTTVKNDKVSVAVNDEYYYVKSDVKKILLIMLAIVIFIIGLYLIDLKTPYLQNIGIWFYKILNIQSQ